MTKVRFAPSPTGLIHIGNVRTALFNWVFAKRQGGQFILRFDDTDRARSKQEYADATERDLRWLGIEPDLIVRQSDRLPLYDAARDKLIAAGRLYPCYETADELDRRRKRTRALGQPPLYDRAALALTDADRQALEAEGRTPHWRFKLTGDTVAFDDLIRGPQAIRTDALSDPVLIREDGSYLYTLTSVVDDIELGITHVVRGEDHVSNTAVQLELFAALDGAKPAFAHHNLLTGPGGEGLSKRLGSFSIADLRADGFEPEAVAQMALLTGTSLSPTPGLGLDDIAEKLAFSMVSHGPARYDPAELQTLNARTLHTLPYAAVADRLAAFGAAEPDLWLAVRENVTKLADIAAWADLIHGQVTPIVADQDRAFITEAAALLPPEPWGPGVWADWTGALKAQSGRKGKALFMPLRLALTGRPDGPELRILLPLLGRKACLDRLS